jgi:lipid A 4'-phosphatase
LAEARSRSNPEGWRRLAPRSWGKLKVAAFLAVFVLAAVMLATALFPELDVALAGRFYEGAGNGFALRSQTTLILLRELGYYLPIVVLALTGVAFLLGKRKPRRGGVLTGRRFLFLALSFALGPGLVVNGVLKEISHRPRPAQIVEFGGTSAFRPWYAVDGACAHNCSFASGEVAGATWLLAPASLLPPPWRAPALALASLVIVAVAALRMAFGGHFASDAAAAVLVTLASIFAVGWAVLRRGGEATPFDAEGRRS